jgi:hypothetical protein
MYNSKQHFDKGNRVNSIYLSGDKMKNDSNGQRLEIGSLAVAAILTVNRIPLDEFADRAELYEIEICLDQGTIDSELLCYVLKKFGADKQTVVELIQQYIRRESPYIEDNIIVDLHKFIEFVQYPPTHLSWCEEFLEITN